MPMNASTIDFGILLRAGNLWERPEQFTIRQKLADGSLELLLSAYKFSSSGSSATNSGTGDETRMPKVGARAAYTFELLGGKQLVAVDGFFQSDKDSATKDDVDRWDGWRGVQIQSRPPSCSRERSGMAKRSTANMGVQAPLPRNP